MLQWCRRAYKRAIRKPKYFGCSLFRTDVQMKTINARNALSYMQSLVANLLRDPITPRGLFMQRLRSALPPVLHASYILTSPVPNLTVEYLAN